MELNEKEKQLLEAIEKKMADKTKGFANAEEIKAQMAELKSLIEAKDFEGVQKRLDEIDIKLKEKKPEVSTKSIREQLLEHLNKDEVLNDIRKGRSVSLELKAATDMSFAGTSSGQAGRVEFAPNIGFDLLRGLMLANLLPEYPTNANAVFYLDATSPQGGAGFVKDDTAAPQRSWTISQQSAPVKDVAVYAAYSQDMIDDIDNFAAQINQRLMSELMVQYDQKLYNGDAGTNPEEFNGLTYYAQAFAVADNALQTTTPNLRDVLNAACAQVEANNGKPNFVLLNPIDYRALKNTKAADGHYVLPWDISPVLMVDGLYVIPNTGVSVGEFLVGDATKGEQHVRQSLNLMIDPYTLSTKRAVRVTLSKRAAFFVKSSDAKAFVKGNIAAAITALTKA
jgi:HK97 family phage major capsid protein